MIVLHSHNGREAFNIDKDFTTIGRAKDCTIRITGDMRLSQHHAQLEVGSGGSVLLTDISRNGTLLNKTTKLIPGQTSILHEGDVVHLVRATDLCFVYHKEAKDLKLIPIDESKKIENDEDKTAQTPIAVNSRKRKAPSEGPSQSIPESLESIQPTFHDPITTFSSDEEDKEKEVAPPPVVRDRDALTNHMTCPICMSVIHNCVAIQPCQHKFCKGCATSSSLTKCPLCRRQVDAITDDHTFNSVIEEYIVQYPHLKRTASDIAECEAKEKLVPAVVASATDNSELTDNDEDDSNDGFEARVLCRWCPQRQNVLRPRGSNAVTCPRNGNHIMCQCCFQPMPAVTQARKQCTHCSRTFCHQLWGCTRAGCRGCLFPLNETPLTMETMRRVINGNEFESGVLMSHLKLTNTTLPQFLNQCVENNGSFTLKNVQSSILTEMTCWPCAMPIISQMAYDFRLSIQADLPDEVTSRPDCWYGENCRSQRNNAQHATRLNHICQQTKF